MNSDNEATVSLFKEEVAFLKKFETPEDLANHFRAAGIKAVRTSARYCAISEHLKQATGAEVRTGATMTTVYLPDVDEIDGELVVSESFSMVMQQFVASFDMGLYPELLKG